MADVRRNEKRFYTYPMNRIAAIVDDVPALDDALGRLEAVHVDMDAVHVLSGPEGRRRLDPEGTSHGWWARLLRLLQRGAFEGTALEVHAKALADGSNVVFVPVRKDPQRQQVIDALHDVGGHHLLHFRRWNIEKILTPPAGERAT